jgi:hypothetical protein
VARIRQALDADEYTRRLPAILEARRRVLEEHNLFAVLARIIQAAGPLQSGTGGLIRSRRAYWRHHPTDRLAGLAVKGRLRLSGWWHTFNRA